MNDRILVTNIQRFSLHDGPGIRTTVFLKGCSLRCPWCSNPENLVPYMQTYVKDGVQGVYGAYYTTEQLYRELIKDKTFYGCVSADESDLCPARLEAMPGGVTFSGGEALLQIDDLEELLNRLQNEQIHTAVETCLFVPEENLRKAIRYIDLFYVDIKIVEPELCRKNLNGNMELYLANLRTLLASGKPIVFRVPVIGGYTDGEENRKRVAKLLRDSAGNLLKVELIKEHDLGISKYRSLRDGGNKIEMPDYIGVTDERMEVYKKEIEAAVGAIPVEICKV